MIGQLRSFLRQQPLWLRLRYVNDEGWGRAWRRMRAQRKALSTPPVTTAREGRIEVRVMTWHRDWLSQLWALKSFYRLSGVDYPLYIHDGGLRPANVVALRRHFPQAVIVQEREAAPKVRAALEKLGCPRCVAFRQKHVLARKLFDYLLLSDAERIVSIDSDIVFFQSPRELLAEGADGRRVNLFNQDESYAYSLPLPELERIAGTTVRPLINSGLFSVWRNSVDFQEVERWLPAVDAGGQDWLVEQTLYALCSSRFGVELLPDTYAVGTVPGIRKGAVCKHYPGYFRHLLYEEGMAHLIRQGFLTRPLCSKG